MTRTAAFSTVAASVLIISVWVCSGVLQLHLVPITLRHRHVSIVIGSLRELELSPLYRFPLVSLGSSLKKKTIVINVTLLMNEVA